MGRVGGGDGGEIKHMRIVGRREEEGAMYNVQSIFLFIFWPFQFIGGRGGW